MSRLSFLHKSLLNYGSLLGIFLLLSYFSRQSLVRLFVADSLDDASYRRLLVIQDVKTDLILESPNEKRPPAAMPQRLGLTGIHVQQLLDLTAGDAAQHTDAVQVSQLINRLGVERGGRSLTASERESLTGAQKLLDGMRLRENQQLTERENQSALYGYQASVAVLLCGGFAFVLTVLLSISSARNAWRQQQAQKHLSEQVAERQQAEQTQRRLADGMRTVLAMADELLAETDWDVFCRRAVELARERLGIERCALYIYDHDDGEGLTGTYGTDMEGRTTDERTYRIGSVDNVTQDKELEASWHSNEFPSRWQVYTGSSLQRCNRGSLAPTGRREWVVVTPIQSDEGRLGVFFNDTAITSTPMDDIQQELLSLYGSLLGNIYAAKAKTSALVKTEEMYRGLVENVFQGIFRCDLDGRFISGNSALAKLYGYDSIEAMAAGFKKDPMDVFADPGRPKQLLSEVLLHDSVADFEMPILRKDGRILWVSKNARLIRDNQGNPLYIEGTVKDITDQKQAEEQLNQRLRHEAALAACSRILLSATAVEEDIPATLQHLLAASEASRVYVFENFTGADGELWTRQRFQVTQPGMEPLRSGWEFPYLPHLERWVETMSVGGAITGLIRYFPAPEREILENRGIRSILLLPLHGSRGWSGYIGFSDLERERDWTEEDIRVLRTAADMIVAFQERKEAEQSLRLSEERSRTLLKSLPQGVFFKDTNHVFVSVNDTLARWFNVQPQDLVGKTDYDCQPPAVAAQFQRDDKRVMTARQSEVIEEQVQIDGTLRYIETIKSPVIADNGEVVGVLGLISDITVRKEYELALRNAKEELEKRVAERTAELKQINDSLQTEIHERQAAEAELREVLQENLRMIVAIDNLEIGVVVTDINDPNDPAIFVNPAFTRITGYEKSAVLGRNLGMLEGPLTDKATTQRLLQSLRERKPFAGTLLCYRKDSSTFWNELRLNPVFDEEGNLLNYIGLLTDVTQRVETEKALAASEERYKTVIRNVNEVLFRCDFAGAWIFLNPAWTTLTGWEVEETLGRNFIEYIHPGDREMALELAESLRATGGHYRQELRYLHKDGSVRWVEADARVLQDKTDQSLGFIGTLMDITDRKLAEEEMRRARQEAEEANMAKSEFLSRMSHELRTPLNAILGFGQLLEQQASDPVLKKRVDYILSGGRHLLGLINEILDLSRIESGRLQLSLETVSMMEMVNEVVDLMQPSAMEYDIDLCLPESATDFYVKADHQRLKQVLLNLMANAIKYNNPGGKVTLEYEVRPGFAHELTRAEQDQPLHAPGFFLRFKIADTGRGIDPALQSRLFTPFDRLGAENSTIQGTGLGLALAKRLIEAMHGSIGVHSRPGHGSTFWIDLPLDESPLAQLPEPDASPMEETSADSPISGTVLYVEDNFSNLVLIEHVLDDYPGVRLLTAMQGQVGLDLARQQLPDLILLDLHMPDLMGWDVLERLRDDPATARIPIVILSADATQKQIQRLMEMGADEYLTKPVNVARLLELVHHYLQAHSAKNSSLSACGAGN